MARRISGRSNKDTCLHGTKGQGEFTRDQYVQEIRKFCGELPYQPGGRKGNSNRKMVSNGSGLRESCRKFSAVDENGAFRSSLPSSTRQIYFVDDEQPPDPESFSSMVNMTTSDPRILPAVVETIRYLRHSYHKLLLNRKPKSLSFFEKKRENLGSRTDSSEEHFSSMSDDSNSERITKVPSDKMTSVFTRRRKTRAKLVGSNVSSSSNSSGSLGSHHLSADPGVDSSSDMRRGRRVTFDTGDSFACSEPFELHAAAASGDIEKVMLLTLDGFDLNAPYRDGFPAFDLALKLSRFKCAIFLVEAGTDIDTYTRKKLKEYEALLVKSRNYMHVMQTLL